MHHLLTYDLFNVNELEIEISLFKLSGLVKSVFPNAISQELEFCYKNLGNFPSRAFGNILFPVPLQYRHSGLASSSRETFGNSQMLPKLKLIILIFGARQNFPVWYRFVLGSPGYWGILVKDEKYETPSIFESTAHFVSQAKSEYGGVLTELCLCMAVSKTYGKTISETAC